MENGKWKMIFPLPSAFIRLPYVKLLHSQRKVIPMAISQELLEILACPACKAKVELKPDDSGLKCVECKRVYPIRDDIPVMLVDEATIEEDQAR
jgi:uncharacterized protein YbaR (Trm112 family)